MTAAPYLRHQDVVGRFYVAFSTHLAAHGGGKVYLAPADMLFSDPLTIAMTRRAGWRGSASAPALDEPLDQRIS